MILSHGQGSVESGFNITKMLPKTNLKEDSFVARKLIIDHMSAKKVEPHEMTINQQLVKSVRGSRQRYEQHLEKKKHEESRQVIDTNKQVIITEINSIKERCEDLEDIVKTLNTKFVELTKKAEEKNELKFLIDGNGMKQKCEEKEEKLEILKQRKKKFLTEKEKVKICSTLMDLIM